MGEGRDCDRCHFEKNVMNDKQKFSMRRRQVDDEMRGEGN